MTTATKAVSSIPQLENGDRLTRDEFERRYCAMSVLKKAELIEGVVYVPSPVRYKSHGQPHSLIMGWLAVYCAATPGIESADNTTVRLDLDNEPQPDALLRIDEQLGGQSRIGKDDYLEGAPELIVEIASSSVSYDLHDKKKVYRRNGVQEYIIWRVGDRQLDWFKLEQGEYVALTPDKEGIIHSCLFPGLNLPVKALLERDLATVLAAVQQGIATEDHQAFVATLAQRRSPLNP
jgi:Uma2 family endonuclease